MKTVNPQLKTANSLFTVYGSTCTDAEEPEEVQRARRYPISRWYLRPAAAGLAKLLSPGRVRPVHLTACGLGLATIAMALLVCRPDCAPAAAALVLAAWFFDRADGQLARRQKSVSAWGAWLDANVDELTDVALHICVASAAASQTGSSWPWSLLIAFLAAKYLFMHSLTTEQDPARQRAHEWRVDSGEWRVSGLDCGPRAEHSPLAAGRWPLATGHSRLTTQWIRRAYHLPGNADVRIHLLVAALLTGWLTAELALVAIYYNLRWITRYPLVARRARRVESGQGRVGRLDCAPRDEHSPLTTHHSSVGGSG